MNSKNVSQWSNPYSFTTEMLTSILENSGKNNETLSIYPNPASEKIMLSDKRFAGTKYSIFDEGGKIINEGIIENDYLFVNELCPGFYYVKVGNKVIKFIKK